MVASGLNCISSAISISIEGSAFVVMYQHEDKLVETKASPLFSKK